MILIGLPRNLELVLLLYYSAKAFPAFPLFPTYPQQPRSKATDDFEPSRSFVMGQPSFQASNAIIYFTYGAFLYEASCPAFCPFLAEKSHLELRVYALPGDGDTNPSRSSWRAIEHRRVSYNVLSTKDYL